MMMFANKPSSQLSLEDLANDFCEQQGIRISKQGIQERFNDYAVAFMNSLLKEQLSRQLPSLKKVETYKFFNRVRVKDSTRYTVPKEYASLYKGHGGISGAAQISIQYEYDLLSGKPIVLELTSACRNDQQDSKETLDNIEKGDLLIRDLAYAGQSYIKHVDNAGAYYLNRLNPKWTITDKDDKPIVFSKILNKLKKHSLPELELDVLIHIGKEQLASRLIVSRVDQETYKKRTKKAQIAAKSKGYELSDKFKTCAWLNLFITNIPKQWLATGQIKTTYSLRWQIELIFKVWKSQAQINKVKAMKVQRFQCQLMAKLLWVLLNWQALRVVQQWIEKNHEDFKCSVWKFYKVAFRLSHLLRQVIQGDLPVGKWLKKIIHLAEKKYFTETKKGKTCTINIVNLLLA